MTLHRFESPRLQILELLIHGQNELCLLAGERTCGGIKQAGSGVTESAFHNGCASAMHGS